MHSQIKADESRIRFENRLNRNRNTVPSLVLKMKQERADEWARRVYEIYCEVWQVQGYVKSAAFLRAVYSRGIVPVLRGRTQGIASDFAQFATRTSFPVEIQNAHLQSLRLNMQRLESRWGRQIEAEAKVCEHIERRERSSVQSQAVDFRQEQVVSEVSRNARGENDPASEQLVGTKSAERGQSVSPPAKNLVSERAAET